MSTNTVTRSDLTDAVYRELGLSRTESAHLVESIIEHVISALLKGETVKIAGFGTFSLRDKSERIGRNPKTGDEVPITPRRVLVFKPSLVLKDRVNTSLAKANK